MFDLRPPALPEDPPRPPLIPDFLVETALSIEGVCGARMTGGGFGGSIVAMLHPHAIDGFQEEIAAAYRQRFGRTPDVYRCEPSSGAGELTNSESIPSPRH